MPKLIKPVKTVNDLLKALNKTRSLEKLEETCNSIPILRSLDSGSSRRVYNIRLPNISYDKYVLKIAMSIAGKRQNKHEVKLIEQVGSKYLANIYWYCSDYSYIISEYAKYTYSTNLKQRDKIRDELSELDIVELHEFGLTSAGKLKLIDYGLSDRIYEKYYANRFWC